MNYKEITSYEEACEVNKQDPNNLPDVSMLSPEEADDVITTIKVKRIIRALNTDAKTGKVWEPDWNDHNQYKYSPWVEVEASDEKPGGFGFSYSYYGNWRTYPVAGSRLCMDTSDKVLHLLKHFTDLLVKFYLIVR